MGKFNQFFYLIENIIVYCFILLHFVLPIDSLPSVSICNNNFMSPRVGNFFIMVQCAKEKTFFFFSHNKMIFYPLMFRMFLHKR